MLFRPISLRSVFVLIDEKELTIGIMFLEKAAWFILEIPSLSLTFKF